jgi:hypothetical protein
LRHRHRCRGQGQLRRDARRGLARANHLAGEDLTDAGVAQQACQERSAITAGRAQWHVAAVRRAFRVAYQDNGGGALGLAALAGMQARSNSATSASERRECVGSVMRTICRYLSAEARQIRQTGEGGR